MCTFSFLFFFWLNSFQNSLRSQVGRHSELSGVFIRASRGNRTSRIFRRRANGRRNDLRVVLRDAIFDVCTWWTSHGGYEVLNISISFIWLSFNQVVDWWDRIERRFLLISENAVPWSISRDAFGAFRFCAKASGSPKLFFFFGKYKSGFTSLHLNFILHIHFITIPLPDVEKRGLWCGSTPNCTVLGLFWLSKMAASICVFVFSCTASSPSYVSIFLKPWFCAVLRKTTRIGEIASARDCFAWPFPVVVVNETF